MLLKAVRVVVLGVAVLLELAGCGGGSSSSTATTPVSTLPGNCVNPVVVQTALVINGPQFFIADAPTTCGFSTTYVSFNHPQAVAMDASGDLFIADTGNHTIREISYTGQTSTLAGTAGQSGSSDGVGSSARFNAPAGIVLDAAGNLYVADTGNQIIRKLVPGSLGWTVSTVAGVAGSSGSQDGSALAAHFNQPHGLSVDDAGVLYIADTGNNRIRQLAAGSVSTVVDASGQLNQPTGLLFSSRYQALFVADTGNHVIRRVQLSNGSWVVSTIAGSVGVAGSADGSGAASIALRSPQGITESPSGTLFVTDSGNDTLRELLFSSSSNTWTSGTLAGVVQQTGNSDSSPGNFNSPTGLVVDANGVLTVLDTGNSAVRRLTGQPTFQTLAGAIAQAGAIDGTISLPSQTPQSVSGMVADSAGNLFMGDATGHFVRSLAIANHSAQTSIAAGMPGLNGATNGSGALAGFAYLTDIARDASGNLYLIDFSAGLIRKVSTSGVVTTLAGNTSTAGTRTDAAGTSASFDQPHGIAVDANGNVFVSDDQTIREISPAGVVTTIAGDNNPADSTSTAIGSVDGPGLSARFNYPEGLACDSAGNVYVADSGNATLRKLTPPTVAGGSWTVSTFAGVAGDFGNTDALGTRARFNNPFRLAIDSSGNLFVADRGNALIRKVTPAGQVTTVVGQQGSNAVVAGALGAVRLLSPSALAVMPGGQLAIFDSGYVLVSSQVAF